VDQNKPFRSVTHLATCFLNFFSSNLKDPKKGSCNRTYSINQSTQKKEFNFKFLLFYDYVILEYNNNAIFSQCLMAGVFLLLQGEAHESLETVPKEQPNRIYDIPEMINTIKKCLQILFRAEALPEQALRALELCVGIHYRSAP
jgi:hypothetical protein